MIDNPVFVTMTVFVWIVTGLAGILLIRAAFQGIYPPKQTKMGAFIQDLRFRFRFVAGIMLVVWVLASMWKFFR